MGILSGEPQYAWSENLAIRGAQEGDHAAFDYLYNLHSGRVYRVILRILKNISDAEDLTQQVFLSLFRKIGTFRGESCLSTWLHRVAVNAALMHLRRKPPAELQTDSLGADAKTSLALADHSMRYAADRINLVRAIQQLPAGCKRLFLLRVVLGYQHQEIARLLGCSVSGSKSQVHKARKRLQELLREFKHVSPNEPATA